MFCRNVLIYFDQETKSGVLDRIARQLEPDGYLVLGAAETVVGLSDAFKPIPDKRGLYAPNKEQAGKPRRDADPVARSRGGALNLTSRSSDRAGRAPARRGDRARAQPRRMAIISARVSWWSPSASVVQSSSLARPTTVPPPPRRACAPHLGAASHDARRATPGSAKSCSSARRAPRWRMRRRARWRDPNVRRLGFPPASAAVSRRACCGRPPGWAVHCASGIARIRPAITGVIQASSENDTS